MKVNVLILAAGNVGFETKDGGYPLCLTEFDGIALIERLVSTSCKIKDAVYTFALRGEDVARYHLDNIVELLVDRPEVISVPEMSKGAACTALVAACRFDPEAEVLIVSANELVDVSLDEIIEGFRERGLDAGALTFRSIHPRYSYVRIDDNGFVVEAAQQNPITQHATTGVFWFARAGDFVEGVKNMIRKDAVVGGNFYIAPVFNELILNQKKVGVCEIDPKVYHPLKTERQVYQFQQEGVV
ncbi:glycosyltransferase family 2 protein [Zoogloea sp.]|uniref:glycosyltransferase family 2 protein n=1 Tax=Zoogloea sp. TaxID=49181 RepID=UPI0035AFDBFE